MDSGCICIPHTWLKSVFAAFVEDIYGGLAKYYDLPWLSLRAATYRLADFLKDQHFCWDKIMNSAVAHDYVHPSVGLRNTSSQRNNQTQGTGDPQTYSLIKN